MAEPFIKQGQPCLIALSYWKTVCLLAIAVVFLPSVGALAK